MARFTIHMEGPFGMKAIGAASTEKKARYHFETSIAKHPDKRHRLLNPRGRVIASHIPEPEPAPESEYFARKGADGSMWLETACGMQCR